MEEIRILSWDSRKQRIYIRTGEAKLRLFPEGLCICEPRPSWAHRKTPLQQTNNMKALTPSRSLFEICHFPTQIKQYWSFKKTRVLSCLQQRWEQDNWYNFYVHWPNHPLERFPISEQGSTRSMPYGPGPVKVAFGPVKFLKKLHLLHCENWKFRQF